MNIHANFIRVSEFKLEEYLNDLNLLHNTIHNIVNDIDNRLNIETSWEGILYLLVEDNSTDHLNRIFFNYNTFEGKAYRVYGKIHYLTQKEVKFLHQILKNITEKEFKTFYDPSKMLEYDIYPKIWHQMDGGFYYLHKNFVKIQNFFSTACLNNEAIISYLTIN